MKLTDRKGLVQEVFNEDEIAEIRAALSDRYDVLTKMAEKEEKHGRKYDDLSWPRKRLAILDGDGLRAGAIDVFNPRSKEETNGDLFEDLSVSALTADPVDPAEPEAPEYENDPASCPHTEIEDVSEDDADTPAFRCTLCGTGIRALATGAAVDPATLHPDRDPAEATLEAIRTVVKIPPHGRARALEVAATWTAEERTQAFDWSTRVGTPAGVGEAIPDHVQALFSAVIAVEPTVIVYECPVCGVKEEASEGLKTLRCSNEPDCYGVMAPVAEIEAAQKAVGTYRQEEPDEDDVVEADYEIVDEEEALPEYVHSLLRAVFPDEDPLPSEETISDWPIADRRAVIEFASAVHLNGTDFMTGDVPPMPEVLKAYLAPELLHQAAEGPPPPTLADLDTLTLEELGVPTRARNTLARYGIETAADYVGAGSALFGLRGIGDITLNEINQALLNRGLTHERAREIEVELVAAGRAFAGAVGGGDTDEVEEEPAGSLYDRVLSVVCLTCNNHGIGAGEICVSVGGNPRNGFHAARIRAAVNAGAIAPDEYDAAYALETNPGAAAGSAELAAARLANETPEDVQPPEDSLPWGQIGSAFGNGKPDDQEPVPGPLALVVLDAMVWPEGPPLVGQRVRDLSGERDGLTIGGVGDKWVVILGESGRPVASVALEQLRWAPMLECWGWGAPETATAGQ